MLNDVEVCGQNLKKGQRIFVLFSAGNRDPLVFDEPDNFDIHRDTKRHMGFGQGKHFCLGMHLARMEMRSLRDALAEQVKSFELTGTAEFAENNTIWGLKS